MGGKKSDKSTHQQPVTATSSSGKFSTTKICYFLTDFFESELCVLAVGGEMSAEAPLAGSPGPSVWMTSLPTSCAALIALISHGGGGDWIPPATELSHTHADTHVHVFTHTHIVTAHGNTTHMVPPHIHTHTHRTTCLHRHIVSICDSRKHPSSLTCRWIKQLFTVNKATWLLQLLLVRQECCNKTNLPNYVLFLCLILQASLNKLMETLGQSEPYFVKCIRSNAEKV